MAATHDPETESAPLLGVGADAKSHEAHLERSGLLGGYHRVTILMTAVVFVITVGSGMTSLPTIRVIEDIVCRRLAATPSVAGHFDEDQCKGDEIQAELSFVLGIQSMVEAIPSLILAVPYGLLADKIGRRPVLVLSIMGMVCGMAWMMTFMYLSPKFPIWTIWLSAAWEVIGGGSSVMISMIYAMISDSEPAESRTNAFYLTVVGSLVAHLVSVPISAQLMRISPWIPLLSGLALVIVGCVCIAFVPETLRPIKHGPATTDSLEGNVEVTNTTPVHSVKQLAHRMYHQLTDSMSIIRSYTVLALVATFVIEGFTNRAFGFTVQYLSKRFHWSLSQAGTLMTVASLISILLHLVILPGCSRLLVSARFGYSLQVKDLALARISAFFLILGSIMLALPSTGAVVAGLVIFTLGSGFQSLCRALATMFVDAEHTARLFTLISVVQACSSLSAGPTVAWLFGQGLKLGGNWVGLPYFGVAALCCIGATAVFTLRLPLPERY